MRPRRFRGRNWSCDIVPRPWYIDAATFGLVLVWMLLTFATIQMRGSSPALIAGVAIVAVIGVLVIYGQRLRYLEIGDYISIGFRTPEDYETGGKQETAEREKYR